MLICKTPFRISLFGGGTDFPGWYLKNKGMVISYTIDKYCYVTLRKLPTFYTSKYRLRYFKNEFTDNIKEIVHPSIKAILAEYDKSNDKLEIIHSADIPGLSGLASSSAFTVSFLNLILNHNHKRKNNFEIGKLAINVEQNLLKESVGSQDQIACAIGGFNKIKFEGKKINYKKINSNNIIKKILSNSLIVFTGQQRKSKIIEKDKISKLKKNKIQMQYIYQTAIEAEKIINNDADKGYQEICQLMKESWKLKKELSKFVTNPLIDDMHDYALKNGATAGKLLGAGGGGFMLLLTKNKNDKIKLVKKLNKFNTIKHQLDYKGTQIVFKDKSDFY